MLSSDVTTPLLLCMLKVKHDFQLANQVISFGYVCMIENCLTLFDRNPIIKLQNQTRSQSRNGACHFYPPPYGRHNLIIPRRILFESDILTTINFNGIGISILPTRACRNFPLHRLLQGRWKLRDLACVASVSVRFRRKELGTRVKDRAKNGASKRGGRGWGRKVRKLGFQNPRVCLQAFPSFPPPFSRFSSRSISRAAKTGLSLLRNQTETLATQAMGDLGPIGITM